MLLWVSQSCCEDTAVPAVLNRWNIQRILNKTYNSWKEITLQLQLGAAHTLPASEGGVFWRRGAEGETGEYSNNFISSSIATAQAGTLPCRACGFLCEAIEFSCCGSKFSFWAVICNLNLNFLIWVTVGYWWLHSSKCYFGSCMLWINERFFLSPLNPCKGSTCLQGNPWMRKQPLLWNGAGRCWIIPAPRLRLPAGPSSTGWTKVGQLQPHCCGVPFKPQSKQGNRA